jgi:arabinogalactan oligomer/maltooligosaccharide transport system substrate-binding protein
MIHRIPKAFLLLAIATVLLAACTGGQIGASDEESEAPPDESAAETEAAYPTGEVAIELWTKEGDPQIEFVDQLATDYMALHENVTIDVVNKDVEVLREDMVNTALSPDAQPELLWTVADHIGPFTEVDVIQQLDDLIDTSIYDEGALAAVQVDGTTWGAPISNGNQLMLYWNKSIVGDEAPADTDELRGVAVENTGDGSYGFVFNVTESFWLVPWLYGFGGSVFEDDGVTPSLDTDAMRGALQFLYDLKYGDQVMPAEVDYDIASGLFTDGQAAMIVNGDWELGNYGDLLGDDLGVGPLPTVTETGEDPKPFTAGSFYMVPSAVEGDTLTVVADFIAWSTDTEQQVAMVEELRRLPANAEALADPIVTDDPLLAGAAEAVVRGVPQPTNVEMRCVFDAMTAGVRDVLAAGNSDVAGVAATMQETAVTCIEQGAE